MRCLNSLLCANSSLLHNKMRISGTDSIPITGVGVPVIIQPAHQAAFPENYLEPTPQRHRLPPHLYHVISPIDTILDVSAIHC